jgi:arylsulfatase A-like enzyme
MAFRMQSSVPELMDVSREPRHVTDLYGPEVNRPGTFAASCLLARRLAERGVRFTQIFHRGWDQHGNVAGDLPAQARDVDHACYGLITDLKQRGMLEDTLVIWGGEFGRTIYCQGALTRANYGRDHHPKCFSIWMAGGGIKPGIVYGATDDFSYNIVENPVHIHDLNATILHCLGIDHRRLTYRVQGLDMRLTGVEEQRPVAGILV